MCCQLEHWRKIVWGGTDGCRISKRGSRGTYHSSWAGSCNPRWDGIILLFHIGCPFVFQATIWRSKCCLAWVWPRIIYITVIVFYSMQNKVSVLNRVYGNVAAIVSTDLISCISCSSEDWVSRTCAHRGRNIKKQVLLMESGPIYNQVSCCLFSDSASLDSYWFRQIWGGRGGRVWISQRWNLYSCKLPSDASPASSCCISIYSSTTLQNLKKKKGKKKVTEPECLTVVNSTKPGWRSQPFKHLLKSQHVQNSASHLCMCSRALLVWAKGLGKRRFFFFSTGRITSLITCDLSRLYTSAKQV